MTPSTTGRKRSRLACQTCRDLKRRCDGARPCGTCVRFEYECIYHEGKTRKSRRPQSLEHTAPAIKPPTPVAVRLMSAQASPEDAAQSTSGITPHNQTRSLEANSGSAFVRKLALRLDPKKNPRMHTFAWNAFLGSRQAKRLPAYHTITELLSLQRMQELATVYFPAGGSNIRIHRPPRSDTAYPTEMDYADRSASSRCSAVRNRGPWLSLLSSQLRPG
ncbi:hypothetical protein J3459_018394 [Metarhizium acridum]|nr:hypothetical protein J3459_018394 [Metarhizium acridum]